MGRDLERVRCAAQKPVLGYAVATIGQAPIHFTVTLEDRSMPTTIELTDEQCIEVRKALDAKITRTKDALSLPFVRENRELRKRADHTISVLCAILKAPAWRQ